MYMNERRMFDRFAIDFPVEIKQSGAGIRTFAQCYDISASGVDLLTEERLNPNAKLELWLGIPDGHTPFRRLARVVWSKQLIEDKWRSGLEFDGIDFMGIRRIFATPTPI